MNNGEQTLTLEMLKKMKMGEQILMDINNLGIKDQPMALAFKHKELIYCIEKDGKPCRPSDSGYIYAEDEDKIGNEKQMHWDFIGMGDLCIKENDADQTIKGFNIRKITSSHPKYDKDASDEGDMMGTLVSMFNSKKI